MYRLLPLLLALAFVAPVHVHAAETAPPQKAKTVRLLTIGNSFSGNATQYLGAITKAGGHTLIHRQAGIGGGTMQQHWEKLEAADRDPNDPRGWYSPKTKRTLRQELAAEAWDFVTIQQASVRSHDVETYRPWARKLYDLVRQSAPTAEVLIHQTWAYRVDDPRFQRKAPPPGEPKTHEEMYGGLTRAYETIAAELGIRIIPVGDAFHAADTDSAWGFKPDATFDPKSAREPALPDQSHSLHRGWYWKQEKGKSTLQMDGHHASPAGCYLAACVWFEFLFEESVLGNSYLPKGVTPDEARYLQKCAHDAVAKRRGR